LFESIASEVRRIQRVTELPEIRAPCRSHGRERVALNELLDRGLSFMKSLFRGQGVTVIFTGASLAAHQCGRRANSGRRSSIWSVTPSKRCPQEAHSRFHGARRQPRVIRISDTGSGMTETQRQHIFKPFFSTKTADGVGLPLTPNNPSSSTMAASNVSLPQMAATLFIIRCR